MGNPGKPSEPLVLYGEAGCGKTSLLAKAFSSVSDNVFVISLCWTSGNVYYPCGEIVRLTVQLIPKC